MEAGKRQWHDRFCIVVLFLMAAACSFILAIAFSKGQPSLLTEDEILFVETEFGDFGSKQVAMLKTDAWGICMSVVISLILATLWFLVLKYTSVMIVYATVFVASTVLFLFGFYLYRTAKYTNSYELFALAMLCWLLAVVVVTITFLFKEQITSGVEIISDGCEILTDRPDVFWITLAAFAGSAVVFLICTLGLVYLYSVPKETHIFTTGTTTTTTIVATVFDNTYRFLFWVLLFVSLWFISVIISIQQYIIARVALYENDRREDKLSVVRFDAMKAGIREALSKSLGTLIFISLLLTFTRFLGILSKYAWRKNNEGTSGPLCCFGFWKLIRYIVEIVTDLSVVMVARKGFSFSKTSSELVHLISDNLGVVFITEVISHYLLVVGQLCGTIIVTAFSIWILDVVHGHIGALTTLAISLMSFCIFHQVSATLVVCVNSCLIAKFTRVKEIPEIRKEYGSHIKAFINAKATAPF
jgi:hypothetical protein